MMLQFLREMALKASIHYMMNQNPVTPPTSPIIHCLTGEISEQNVCVRAGELTSQNSVASHSTKYSFIVEVTFGISYNGELIF